MIFQNRNEAGELLAQKLKLDGEINGQLVLAVSPAGMTVGQSLASRLNCPLTLHSEGQNIKDKIIIIADDGIATGETMIQALKSVWQKNPKKVIVAVPIIAKEVLAKIEELADEVIYLEAPEVFISLSEYYKEF